MREPKGSLTHPPFHVLLFIQDLTLPPFHVLLVVQDYYNKSPKIFRKFITKNILDGLPFKWSL